MVKQKIADWFQQEKQKLSSMNGRQRMAYIWTYYKGFLIGIAFALIMVVLLLQDVSYNKKDVLISGILVNAEINQDGYDYLRDGYWQYCGADPATRAEAIETHYLRTNVQQPSSADVNTMMSIDAMIAGQELDYMIVDSDTLAYYDKRGFALDLAPFLTSLPEGVDTLSSETGVIAISLNNTKLQQFGLRPEPAYLMAVTNTPRQDRLAAFLSYLFS